MNPLSNAGEELPRVQFYKYDDWPEKREGAREMEFRLVYQGKLPAVSRGDTRVKEKHRIRKALHPQLRELWKADQYLRKYWMEHEGEKSARYRYDELADNYAKCGYRFLPLIGSQPGDDACALDILFLRRDQPGDLVKHGGDIDNRMKVLFDALRMPEDCSEVAGEAPGPDEDPFFCLLKDDRLITELKITTDRLLTPVSTGERINDVHLVIHVRTISYGIPLYAE